MKIKAEQIPGAGKLYIDYIQDYSRLSEFFAHPYAAEQSFLAQVERIRSRQYPRIELGRVLEQQNGKFGAGEATFKNIENLALGNANVIITGQQVGLFGGPLFVLYKALTAIKLADRLSRTCKDCFVPVFWLASDDADYAEINHVSFVAKNGELQRLALPGQPEQIPAAQRMLPAEIRALSNTFGELMPDTEFKQEVFQTLLSCYRPGVSMSESFARWIMSLMQEFGLILVDPSDPALKALQQQVYYREVAEESPSTRAALAAAAALEKRGYPPQVNLRDGFLNLFYTDNERHALARSGDAIKSTDGAITFSVEEALQRIREQPERWGPNVVLRPLTQDMVFPTVAYVAGPAEIAYFAQLKDIYAHFQLPMPIVYPRKTLTLLEPAIDRILDKYGLTIPQIWAGVEDIVTAYTRANLPEALLQALSRYRAEMPDAIKGLQGEISAIDPTLEKMVDSTAARIAHAVDVLEKKVVQAGKRKNTVVRQQLQRVATSVFPQGTLQERVHNFTPFLVKYGPYFIERVYEVLDIASFEHQLIHL